MDKNDDTIWSEKYRPSNINKIVFLHINKILVIYILYKPLFLAAFSAYKVISVLWPFG